MLNSSWCSVTTSNNNGNSASSRRENWASYSGRVSRGSPRWRRESFSVSRLARALSAGIGSFERRLSPHDCTAGTSDCHLTVMPPGAPRGMKRGLEFLCRPGKYDTIRPSGLATRSSHRWCREPVTNWTRIPVGTKDCRQLPCGRRARTVESLPRGILPAPCADGGVRWT